MDREKLIKGVLSVAVIIILCTAASRLLFGSGETLQDYASKNPETAYADTKEEPGADENMNTFEENTLSESVDPTAEPPAEELENEERQEEEMFPDRVLYQEGFYYEPLNEQIKAKITGCSYPAPTAEITANEAVTASKEGSIPSEADAAPSDIISGASDQAAAPSKPEISYEDLRYVHILHYDFAGNVTEGELICNALIAQDLVEIFYELYRAEYQLEKVRLIDEYLADDDASMEDNNTSCFNYRVVEGSETLSKHAYGLAIDINPFYNPYVRYNSDGSLHIDPRGSEAYADRSADFPYKIDANDLCLRLFKEHGFTWGGDWNSMKDYQHFQKVFD